MKNVQRMPCSLKKYCPFTGEQTHVQLLVTVEMSPVLYVHIRGFRDCLMHHLSIHTHESDCELLARWIRGLECVQRGASQETADLYVGRRCHVASSILLRMLITKIFVIPGLTCQSSVLARDDRWPCLMPSVDAHWEQAAKIPAEFVCSAGRMLPVSHHKTCAARVPDAGQRRLHLAACNTLASIVTFSRPPQGPDTEKAGVWYSKG